MANEKNETKEYITPEMYKITDKNCKTLLKEKKLTQQQLAHDTSFSVGTVSNYVNCESSNQFPSISFLVALQQKYGISIDEFITKELAPTQLQPPTPTHYEEKELEAYRTYCGFYYCYYFDTSMYKGKDYKSDEASLLYGIIHIFRDPVPEQILSHSCLAVLGFKTPESVQTAMAELSSRFDGHNVSDLYKYIEANDVFSYNAYYGDFELNSINAFLTLRHKDKDRALIILHRVPSKSSAYTGGIGTVNSVSRGREPMPVVQFIGLSRNFISLPAEEIHHNLQLGFPSLQARDASSKLIQKFKDLYLSTDTPMSSYSDFDKELVMSGNIDFTLKELLKKNLFRYGKISDQDDDEWYHFIKDSTRIAEESKKE